MFAELIKSKFPQDERLGLFVAPNLPAVKLGKVLMGERKVKQPGDVIAFHIDSGFFSSSYVILTDTECFYPGGSLKLDEIRDAKADGTKVIVTVNLKGGYTNHEFFTASAEAANVLAKILNDISDEKPESQIPPPSYEGFDVKEVNWLKLRDEVMKTIDLLFEKFNDGKLSLIDYEEKKQELLGRL